MSDEKNNEKDDLATRIDHLAKGVVDEVVGTMMFDGGKTFAGDVHFKQATSGNLPTKDGFQQMTTKDGWLAFNTADDHHLNLFRVEGEKRTLQNVSLNEKGGHALLINHENHEAPKQFVDISAEEASSLIAKFKALGSTINTEQATNFEHEVIRAFDSAPPVTAQSQQRTK